MRPHARMAVALLIAAVLLLPLAPTHEAHAKIVVPEGAGLVDPATGEWHLRGPDGFTTSFYYGDPGDFPIMGDWNCDDIDTPGLYRQSDGNVYLRNSNTQGNADVRFYFGNPGDIPLAGDFNGDGCDTVSIYRQSEGRVYIINELGENDGGLGAADYAYYFGNPGDKPFVGDFDGDGIDTVGLHRESTGLVYFRNSNTQGNAEFEFYFGDPETASSREIGTETARTALVSSVRRMHRSTSDTRTRRATPTNSSTTASRGCCRWPASSAFRPPRSPTGAGS